MKSNKLLLFVIAALAAVLPIARGGTGISLNVTATTNAASPNVVVFHVAFANQTAAAMSDVRLTSAVENAQRVLGHAIVINDLPPPFEVTNEAFTNANSIEVRVRIPSFAGNSSGRLTIEIPYAAGANLSEIVNSTTILAAGQTTTDTVAASEATNGGDGGGGGTGTTADLTALFTLPPFSNPIAGDFFDLTVTATNKGPAIATNATLTMTFDGLTIRSVNPSQPLTTNAQGNVPLTLGNLAPNQGAAFTFNVTTTNSRTYNLTAVVSSSTTDTNTADNTVNFPLAIAPTNSPDVAIEVTAPMGTRPNLQTGLFEETVTVRNTGGDTMQAFRLNVTGMNATNILYNAQGTNMGNPFVVYPRPVPPGGAASLILEYFNARRQPIPPSPDRYYVTELLSYQVPTNATPSTNIFVTVTNTIEGRVLVQWPATIGNRYTVIYSDDVNFTNNVFRAQPSVVAPGTIVQWHDTGPPKTIPTDGTTRRFYRVIEGQ